MSAAERPIVSMVLKTTPRIQDLCMKLDAALRLEDAENGEALCALFAVLLHVLSQLEPIDQARIMDMTFGRAVQMCFNEAGLKTEIQGPLSAGPMRPS